MRSRFNRCEHQGDGLRCRFRKGHRGKHSPLKVKVRRSPEPRPHPLSSVAADAHVLVDRALAQGRNYLYVDGRGRIRDVRHDADVSALPPRPPDSPARAAQIARDVTYAETTARAPEPEMVNHPSHYGGDSRYEVIKVIEAHKLNFNMGNAVAYVLRADHKNRAVEDLRKAVWYLNREITLREGPVCADCGLKMLPAPQGAWFCDNCGGGSGAS